MRSVTNARRDTLPRKCRWRLCITTIEHLAPQARFCSRACKQRDYKERTDPAEQPSQLWVLPAVEEVEGGHRVGEAILRLEEEGWVLDCPTRGRLVFDRQLTVGQARARARWKLGVRAEGRT